MLSRGFYSQTVITPPEPSVEDGYPRMAAGRIGTRNWGDNPDLSGNNGDVNTEERLNMATTHFSVINGQPSLSSGRRAAMLDWLVWSKANHPDHVRYQYFISNETGTSFSGDKHDMLVAEDGPPGQTVAGGSPVPQNCWYARDGDGNLEETFPGTVAVNLTTFVQPNQDTAEDRYYGELYVDEVWPATFLTPFASSPFDGYFIDVFDHRPKENSLDYAGTNSNNNARADWNDDGFGESVADAYRDGQARVVNRINLNYPGQFNIIVNGTTHPMESQLENPRLILNSKGLADQHPEYKNLFNGAWAEGQSVEVGGNAFSGIQSDGTYHTFGRPRMQQNNIHWHMRHCLAPKHVMNQWQMEVTSISRNPVVGTHCTADAMAMRRFGHCSNLLDDAYYYCGIATASNPSSRYNYTAQWDEDGTVNTGTTGLSREWLGPPLEDPLRTKEWDAAGAVPWIASDEIYKREYTNGLVIVRWDYAGTSIGQTITGTVNIPVVGGGSLAAGQIPSGVFKEINGFQDNAINNNRVINTTNFPSGYPLRRMDGRVFERV